MTFDEVGVYLAGLEKGMRRTGGFTAIILVQIGPVVQALEQFSRTQSEREQTLVT